MNFNQIWSNDKDLQLFLMGGPKMCCTSPRWRRAAMLKKLKNCYTSANVWRILRYRYHQFRQNLAFWRNQSAVKISEI